VTVGGGDGGWGVCVCEEEEGRRGAASEARRGRGAQRDKTKRPLIVGRSADKHREFRYCKWNRGPRSHHVA
jgi:hypothetical protein